MTGSMRRGSHFHHGSGFGAAVAAHADPSRTVWSVINTLDWWLMGIHPVPQLMQTLVASLVEAGLILAVARRLGMPLLAGATLALLVLLWPAADSSRLWATGAQQTIAVVLLLAGFLVALIGLDRHGSWSVVLHCLAVVLYVASMLDYELTAPVILLAGFVYVHQVGWRRGGWRWALDAIAVVTTLLHRDLTTHKHSFGVSADLDHARAIGDQALTLAAHSVLPVGGVPRAAVLIGIGGVVGVGLVLAVSGPPSQRQRARRNVGYLAAGAAVVVAGYLMIVPADPGYQPDSAGVGNRINAVAALGFALIVVALCGIVGQVAARASTGGSGRRVRGSFDRAGLTHHRDGCVRRRDGCVPLGQGECRAAGNTGRDPAPRAEPVGNDDGLHLRAVGLHGAFGPHLRRRGQR